MIPPPAVLPRCGNAALDETLISVTAGGGKFPTGGTVRDPVYRSSSLFSLPLGGFKGRGNPLSFSPEGREDKEEIYRWADLVKFQNRRYSPDGRRAEEKCL